MTCYKSVTNILCYFASDLCRPGAFTILYVCFFFSVFFQKFNWSILETNQNVNFSSYGTVCTWQKKKSLVLRTDLAFHSLLFK
jgi:hypothetical protein